MRKFLPLIILSLGLNAFGEAKLPPCSIEMIAGAKCTSKIEDLHPTQPEVGQYQVKKKVEEFENLSEHEIEKVIEKKIVPVVIGPEGKLYLIDHHHNSLALLKTGNKNVHILVKENWSNLELKTFWEKMNTEKYCFLKKADGSIADPLSKVFPKSLRECGDNPYRSLVWIMSEEGLLKEVEIPYYEFYLSEVLKKKGLIIPPGEMSKKDIKKYVKEATKILSDDDVKQFVKTVEKEGSTCDIHALLRNFK